MAAIGTKVPSQSGILCVTRVRFGNENARLPQGDIWRYLRMNNASVRCYRQKVLQCEEVCIFFIRPGEHERNYVQENPLELKVRFHLAKSRRRYVKL